VELFIIRVKFAIYYFLHCNTVRQVAARLWAKSAIYDCLVIIIITVIKLWCSLVWCRMMRRLVTRNRQSEQTFATSSSSTVMNTS